ncbi:hypothetical protein [Geotalea toluenoxydans]
MSVYEELREKRAATDTAIKTAIDMFEENFPREFAKYLSCDEQAISLELSQPEVAGNSIFFKVNASINLHGDNGVDYDLDLPSFRIKYKKRRGADFISMIGQTDREYALSGGSESFFSSLVFMAASQHFVNLDQLEE